MTQPDLPHGLTSFIEKTLPSYEAAVFLVQVAREPDRAWRVQELVKQMGSDTVSEREVEAFVDFFEREEFLRKGQDGTFRLQPSTEERSAVVRELVDAYDHRPVKLIRMARSIALAKIRSFSESFRLKRD